MVWRESSLWAPAKFSAGRLAGYPDLAVLSCRYQNQCWADLSRFAKATGGFKPGKQLDGELEIKKHVSGKVLELDNAPTAGFKLVLGKTGPDGRLDNGELAWMKYVFEWHRFVVEDPRGFKTGISEEEFTAILEASGGKLDGWVFPVELVYVWISKSLPPKLVPASSEIYRAALAATAAAEKKAAARKFLKPADLKPGEIYMAARTKSQLADETTETCRYLGRSDVFSHQAISIAIRTGRYPDKAELEAARQEYSGRMSYYWKKRFGNGCVDASGAYVFGDQAGSFWTARSVSKLFPEDLQADRPATLDPSLDLSSSCVFSRLDLSREISFGPLQDVDVFAKLVLAAAANGIPLGGYAPAGLSGGDLRRANLALREIWPFHPDGFTSRPSYPSPRYTAPLQTRSGLAVFQLDGLSSNPGVLQLSARYYGSAGIAWSTSGNSPASLCAAAIASLQPEIPRLFFQDGRRVPDLEAILFSAEALQASGRASFNWIDK